MHHGSPVFTIVIPLFVLHHILCSTTSTCCYVTKRRTPRIK